MKTILLIPTYNEKDNLEKIIIEIKKNINTDILVIDDNSPDGTGKLADRLASNDKSIHVLHREKKEGLGMAYIAGYRWVLEKDYEIIIQMDCDFSHDPKYLPDMVKLMKTNDFVQGSRYISGVSCCNWPLRRILISKCANIYAQLLTKLPLTDSTGGFKLFHRKVLEKIKTHTIKTHGYSFMIEINYRTWKSGFKMKEFPIIFYERQKGKSKMSKAIIIEAFFLILKMGLRLYRF